VRGGQKVVASIGLGAALAVFASAVSAKLNDPSDGGWFMYAPESTSFYSGASSKSTLGTAAIWLATIAIWFGVSWRLFRSNK